MSDVFAGIIERLKLKLEGDLRILEREVDLSLAKPGLTKEEYEEILKYRSQQTRMLEENYYKIEKRTLESFWGRPSRKG